MTNRILRAGFIVSLVMFLGVSVQGQQVTVPAALAEYAYPDLIIYNGKIVTMDDHSLSNSLGSTFQAMAVHGERIQFLGALRKCLAMLAPRHGRLI